MILFPTATKSNNSGLQQILLATSATREVHVVPFDDVYPVVLVVTATANDNSGDQQMLVGVFVADVFKKRCVQVIPSGLVYISGYGADVLPIKIIIRHIYIII